jgi:CPA2 family monovalent cation:H+ antiporter-2
MVFDPKVLVEHPWHVLATVGVIVVGKSLAAIALVLLLRYPARTAFVVAAGLAQAGEFSFILAGLCVELELLPRVGHSLVLAGALISIALNAVVFRAGVATRRWLERHPRIAARLEPPDNPLAELR